MEARLYINAFLLAINIIFARYLHNIHFYIDRLFKSSQSNQIVNSKLNHILVQQGPEAPL